MDRKVITWIKKSENVFLSIKRRDKLQKEKNIWKHFLILESPYKDTKKCISGWADQLKYSISSNKNNYQFHFHAGLQTNYKHPTIYIYAYNT